jgi:hypothetical protein
MRGKGYRLRTQGVIFGVVGLSGTVLNTCPVYVLHGLVRRPLPAAAALASEPAVLNNYLSSSSHNVSGNRTRSLPCAPCPRKESDNEDIQRQCRAARVRSLVEEVPDDLVNGPLCLLPT